MLSMINANLVSYRNLKHVRTEGADFGRERQQRRHRHRCRLGSDDDERVEVQPQRADVFIEQKRKITVSFCC